MFKKKEKTEKAPKNKKVRTMKVGTHKKSVLLLWAVLLASTSFGVYKNFTAIDTHTVHEKEIIQLRLNDTNGIENFVKNFAKAYYSWDTSKEAIEARTTEISKYLTKELQDRFFMCPDFHGMHFLILRCFLCFFFFLKHISSPFYCLILPAQMMCCCQ